MIEPFALSIIAAQPAAGGGNPMMPFFIEIGALFLLFWFVILRPQQKQKKQQEARLLALRKGDQIVTAGGIVGEVIHIKESTQDGNPVSTMEDRVTIKSADTRLVVERGRIARVESATTGGSGLP
jgi:preprotein translocase subunit YajC